MGEVGKVVWVGVIHLQSLHQCQYQTRKGMGWGEQVIPALAWQAPPAEAEAGVALL